MYKKNNNWFKLCFVIVYLTIQANCSQAITTLLTRHIIKQTRAGHSTPTVNRISNTSQTDFCWYVCAWPILCQSETTFIMYIQTTSCKPLRVWEEHNLKTFCFKIRDEHLFKIIRHIKFSQDTIPLSLSFSLSPSMIEFRVFSTS